MTFTLTDVQIRNVKVLLILGLFIFIPNLSYATSGACSSHGGVNCSAQISRYDRVTCNDGWTNSSVYYYESDECQASSCTPPSGSGCKTESDYGALSVRLTSSGSYLGGSASSQKALNQCRNEINAYQSALQTYNSCMSRNNSNTSSYANPDSFVQTQMQQYCVTNYGPDSYNDSVNQKCACKTGYKFGKSGRCVPEAQYCLERIGAESYFNTSKQVCSCNNGYILGVDDRVIDGVSQCSLAASYCAKEYGPKSWYDNETGKCSWCTNGGIRENGVCMPPTIPTPTSTPSLAERLQQLSAQSKSTTTSTLPEKIQKINARPAAITPKVSKIVVVPVVSTSTLEDASKTTSTQENNPPKKALKNPAGSFLQGFFNLFTFLRR